MAPPRSKGRKNFLKSNYHEERGDHARDKEATGTVRAASGNSQTQSSHELWGQMAGHQDRKPEEQNLFPSTESAGPGFIKGP